MMAIAALIETAKQVYSAAGLECGDALLPPADATAVDAIAEELSLPVPSELREVYRIHGGQKEVSPGITGLFGEHRLLSPVEVVEHYQMFAEFCLLDPLPVFPPREDEEGYWMQLLIPFASWDAYDLCIHAESGEVGIHPQWWADPSSTQYRGRAGRSHCGSPGRWGTATRGGAWPRLTAESRFRRPHRIFPQRQTLRYWTRAARIRSGEIRLEDAMKSTVDEIRQRFDADVERFSNLETGQSATVDAPLALALIAQAAAAATPHARHVLDVGCGAGNYTLKLLESLPNLDATLIDLSQPMLDRARERVGRATTGRITTVQSDVREFKLPKEEFDVVLAAAVLHHLRTDQEWRDVFVAIHEALRPGGSVWIFDLVESSIPAVQTLMRQRYGEYLTRLKDEAYRNHVFSYVEKEDTPRSLLFQLDLLREVGFAQVEVLHKNVCFAAFGAVKGGE